MFWFLTQKYPMDSFKLMISNPPDYKGDLIKLDNAILTPHISTYTEICREDMEMQAVQNLLNEI